MKSTSTSPNAAVTLRVSGTTQRPSRRAGLNSPVITTTARILDRGYAGGVFRRRVDPVDLHMMISAFCFFRVANQHTFLAAFGRDLVDPASHERDRAIVGDMVVSYLTG